MRAARPAMSGALLSCTFFPIFRTFLRRSAALTTQLSSSQKIRTHLRRSAALTTQLSSSQKIRTQLRRSAALRRSSAALRRSERISDDQQHSDSQGALLRGGDFRLSHLWDFRKYDRFPLTVVKLSPTLDKGGQGLTMGLPCSPYLPRSVLSARR